MPGDVQDRASTCQKCGYRLAGLPDSHVCPECGLAYDPHSLFLTLGGRSNTGKDLLAALALAGWFTYLGFSTGRVLDYLPCVVPLLIFALFAGRRWFGAVETGKTLTLNRNGIRFTHPDLKPQLIEWSRFGRAQVSRWTGGFCVRDRAGKKILHCRYFQLGSYARVTRLVRQINTLATIYAPRVDSGVSKLTQS